MEKATKSKLLWATLIILIFFSLSSYATYYSSSIVSTALGGNISAVACSSTTAITEINETSVCSAPWTGGFSLIGDILGDGARQLFNMSNVSSANLTLSGNMYSPLIVSGNLSGNSTWQHQSYPAACPVGSAVTALGDSTTCTDSWLNSNGDNMTGNLMFDSFSNVSMVANIEIVSKVAHEGDLNTNMEFTASRLRFRAAGATFMDIRNTAQDYVEFNTNEIDIDFIVNSNGASDAIFVLGDGVNPGYVGMGTNSPDATLDVNGNVSIQNLSGVFGGGSAYVCVSNSGVLFASDTACA